jgi:hypothetical protein
VTAVPVVRTWVAGEVVLASYFNTYLNGPIGFLLAPPILKIRQTAAQSIPNNAATALNFDTEDADSSNMHSTVTNTSRATAVYPGWVWASGNYSAATNATGVRTLAWSINGTPQNGLGSDFTGVTAATTARLGAVGGLWFLNVGDYLELLAFQNSGGALNTAVAGQEQSSMSLHWVSN